MQGVQGDLAHRKRELTSLKLELQYGGQRHLDPSLLSRAAIVFAYAHWEGFVKSAGQRYIKHINSEHVLAPDLLVSLQTLLLLGHFKRSAESKNAGYLSTVLLEMDKDRTQVFAVNASKVIDTESNLTSRVFNDLLLALGLESLPLYQTRAGDIDVKLVHNRNQVAHGELAVFQPSEAIERIETAYAPVRQLLGPGY